MGAPHLRAVEASPYNAEPPSLAELTSYPITPSPLVYARNHSVIPDLRAHTETYTLTIDGIHTVNRLDLSFTQVRDAFPQKHVLAALVCAGNRRAKMAEKTGRDVNGIKWSENIIANVRWSGAPLREVLLRAGVPDDRQSWVGLHACFASHIKPCQDDDLYGSSIPLDKAMNEDGDVLLAYEMNGEPLTPDHGFPLRIVVPGCGGMRWVKWVDHITISRTESPNFYQQRDYKILPEHVTSKATADEGDWWSQVPSMQNLPCNSVVTNVKQSWPSCLGEVPVKICGYAYSDCPIERVEMSVDGGVIWNQCEITYKEGHWSWALWEWVGDIGPMLGEDDFNKVSSAYSGSTVKLTVLSRAKDSTGRVQVLTCPWNLRGVGYSGAGEAVLNV